MGRISPAKVNAEKSRTALTGVSKAEVCDLPVKPRENIHVLVVCCSPEGCAKLESILEHAQCRVSKVDNCRHAVAFLCREQVPVILCERTLPDGDWRDILGFIAPMPDPPALIVSSDQADERLWAEVLNLGGDDLVSKPFEEEEVQRVVKATWRRWMTAHATFFGALSPQVGAA